LLKEPAVVYLHCGTGSEHSWLSGWDQPCLIGAAWTWYHFHQTSLLETHTVREMCFPGCWHSGKCL